jgi:arginyl-tRNA synthetase
LRLFLDSETLPQWLLPYIIDRGSNYGIVAMSDGPDHKAPGDNQKRVVIEFSSPNIASEFQGKHLRSTILGAQLSNLYRSLGWDVVTINYLGDWGKPIGLLGAGFARFGSQSLLDAEPIAHLRDVYHRTYDIFRPEELESRKARDEHGDDAAREVESRGLYAERNGFFKRMEEGDEEALEFAKRFREVSIQDYTQLYARINVNFDEYSGESQVSQDAMAQVIQIMKDKDLIVESGGALTINLKVHGGSGTAIIRSREGSSTYLLRDLAAVLERHRRYSFDKMIYVVAADNKAHFVKVFKILHLMGFTDLADKLQHVSFSDKSYLPKSGDHEQTLASILDRCEDALHKAVVADPQKLAQLRSFSPAELCTSTMFAHVSSVKTLAELVFDVEKLASFDSSPGPELLAWLSSLSSTKNLDVDFTGLSINDSKGSAEKTGLPETDDADSSPKPEEVARKKIEARAALLRLLVHYPEAVDAAFKAKTPEPSVIMAYLMNITSCLSVCVDDQTNIIPENQMQRQLFQATRIVLENGLKLLGLAAQ